MSALSLRGLTAGQPSLRVLFVAPECAPLTKTGGLGDVCAALPAALRSLGTDVRVLMPGYTAVLRATAGEALGSVSALGHDARLLDTALPNGVPLLVLDCPSLYARPGGPYLSPQGEDWPDNAVRFGLLSRVAALLGTDASPLRWAPDIVHCHDWPSALAPAYLRFASGRRAASLLTIHNLAFQGNFDPSMVERLELPRESFSTEGLEFYGRLSFLKGGIAYADLVNTVSPGYAREIQTPEFGCGLEGLLRKRSDALSGILNGVDISSWSPDADPHLPRQYGASSLERKGANKTALQRRMGLAADPDVPLIGQVGRLTEQKGIDLVLGVAGKLAELAQLVFLGSGDATSERALAALAVRYPGRVAVRIGFDEALAHLIEAGADIFLMPSRYEPCGLNQMYSQRYGTPPVARATGGLADTIDDGRTGFLFEGATGEALVQAVQRALAVYGERDAWRAMQRAGMERDFSWNAAARQYAALYRNLATRERS
jgi:starch synthase